MPGETNVLVYPETEIIIRKNSLFELAGENKQTEPVRRLTNNSKCCYVIFVASRIILILIYNSILYMYM